MFEDDENTVLDDNTENVEEQATEQLVEGEVDDDVENTEDVEDTEIIEEPKKYTEEEFKQKVNELLGKKMARKEEKIRREYEKKYSKAENILKAGFGTETIEEATDKMIEFYKEKGIQIPVSDTKNTYSARENKILAEAEAKEIIESGFDEVIDETEKLKQIGTANMTAKEKEVFKILAEYVKIEEDKKELNKIGVKSEELLNDSSFNDFISKLNPELSLKEKYEIYKKFQPKKEVEPIGSMKNNVSKEKELKDYYSFEEAKKFNKEDYMKNPKLMEIVEKSASKWK